MAKAKRTTQAVSDAPRLTMANLQAQIDELCSSTTAAITASTDKLLQLETQLAQTNKSVESGFEAQRTINTSLQSDSNAIEESLDRLSKSLEKFGGENGQISQAISKVKSIEERIVARTGNGWLSWIPVAVVALAVALFVGSQRGGQRGSPTPAPDEFEQSIIEDSSRPRSLTGLVVFVHDRDPMPPADAKILQAAESLADENDQFQFRSYDSEDDRSTKVANYISKAKGKGIDPPFMVHIRGDKESFAPMATDWAGVMKAFAR